MSLGDTALRFSPGRFVLFVAAVLLAAAFVLPMLYTVLSSLKPIEEITKVPLQWVPESLDSIRLNNYSEPLARYNFGRYIANSIFVGVLVTLASLTFCTMAGYSLSKFAYFGRDTFFMVVLITLMIPLEVTFIPMLIIVRKLDMMNSYWGLIVPVMITPFGVFWMRQFIMTIPNDYAEAARIDGLNEFQIFWRIIFPMCKPALGALAILTFMSNWNSLIWPLIVAAKRDLWTIPVGLISFQSEYFKPLNLIFAMAVVSVLPTIILFALVRRRLLEGIGMAGIKG
jgi:ABC-type glycerol-3-phosphate transport system permease component